jgi:hypothetical protein
LMINRFERGARRGMRTFDHGLTGRGRSDGNHRILTT